MCIKTVIDVRLKNNRVTSVTINRLTALHETFISQSKHSFPEFLSGSRNEPGGYLDWSISGTMPKCNGIVNILTKFGKNPLITA